MTQDWKEDYDRRFLIEKKTVVNSIDQQTVYIQYEPDYRMTIKFIEDLLKVERNAVLEEALTNVDKMAVYQLQEGGSQYVSKKMLKILLESLKHHE